MNNKALTLSLLMAVVAVFFVQSYVGSVEEEARKKYGTEILVVTAKRDIKEMETVNDTMVGVKLVPTKYLEPGAISFDKKDPEDKEIAKSLKALAGTVAIVPLKKGEQVTYSKINEPNIRTGLAPQITPGRRAIPIPVSETSGVAKLVKPGDRVDLIAILDGGGGRENKIAKTVLQDIVVLAVGRQITNNAPRTVEFDSFSGKEKVRSLVEDFSFATVTLELEPLQAQALALVLANSDNAVSLSLRNSDDQERVNLGATTVPDLIGADALRLPNRGIAGKR